MSVLVKEGSRTYQFGLFTGSIVLPSFAAIVIFQFFRLSSALPTVLQDEYVYSVGSKYGGNQEAAQFGNFLYYELYGLTAQCGPEFYSCAKAFNSFWYLGLLLVLYAFSVRYFGKYFSFILVGVFGLGPFGLYSSLYMPEMMYFFFVSLGIVFFVEYWEKFHEEQNLAPLIVAFVAIGFGSLVKPHAAFLAFGLFALLAAAFFFVDKRDRLRKARDAVLAIGSFFFSKLAVGWIIAGSAGLTIFGTSYTGALVGFFSDLFEGGSNEGFDSSESQGTLSDPESSQSIMMHMDVFFIHFVVLLVAGVILLGPLVAPLIFQRKILKGDASIVLLSQFLIIGLIASLFAAYVTAQGDDHSDRLLFRYFEYLLPFLIILGIRNATRDDISGWRKYVGAALSLLSIIFVFTGIQDRQWGIVDSVFLYSVFSTPDSQWIWAAILAVTTYLIFIPTKFRSYGPLVIFSIGVLVIGQMGINNQLRLNSTKIASDYAGEHVYENFPEVAGEDILVIGSNRKLVEASMFAIDKPSIDYELLPEGGVIDIDYVVDRYQLVVQTTGVSLSGDGKSTFQGEGFAVTIID